MPLNRDNLPPSVLPDTTDRAICFLVDGILTTDQYGIAEDLFDEMLARQGEIRLLILYKTFAGWEETATKSDMDFTLRYSDHITRIALVNPPPIMMMQLKLRHTGKQQRLNRFYDTADYAEALTWINA